MEIAKQNEIKKRKPKSNIKKTKSLKKSSSSHNLKSSRPTSRNSSSVNTSFNSNLDRPSTKSHRNIDCNTNIDNTFRDNIDVNGILLSDRNIKTNNKVLEISIKEERKGKWGSKSKTRPITRDCQDNNEIDELKSFNNQID